MSTKLKTKKIEETAAPVIHIRVKRHVTYFVDDGLRIAVTTSRVVKKRRKETNDNLA
jgi:hypothetical protein